MKYNTILVLATLFVAGVQSLFAQNACDTCFVALDLGNKVEPFSVKADASGNASGVISTGLNGDIYLYTNRPIVKMVNESEVNFRNKNTGEYRVVLFDCGHATTYDYVRQRESGNVVFTQKGVRNFQNSIYFSGDLQQSRMYFQLENNENLRRYLQIRQMSGEFGGIDKIQVTVASEDKADTTYVFGDNVRMDTIVLYPGQSIKKVSATRFSNGVLNSISYNDQKLAGEYTFRNSTLVSETDRLAARSATLTTTDSTMALTGPGVLSLEYSFMEGNGNSQSEQKRIAVAVGVLPIEEGSNAWIWWLLILLVAGGVGGYYYRRYQLKKNGIIPETDAEKVVRLTKEAVAHENTIKDLRQVEANLLSDKDKLQHEVQSLNESHAAEVKRLNQALQTSKNETLEKVAESNGYHDQLKRLQQHTDEVQASLDEARRQISVYESGEEQKEIRRLNDHIVSLKEAHQLEMNALESKKQREMEALISENEAKMSENLYECEMRITAVNSEKENAVAAAVASKEATEQRLNVEMTEAIANLTAEKEETVAAITAEKEEAVAAAEADRDAKVKAALSDRDQKVAAALADRDAKVKAALEEKEDTVKRLIIEKDDAISNAISEKEEAIGIAITEKETAIAAAEADRDAKVAAAIADRNEKIAAAEADRDAKVAAAIAERDKQVAAAQTDRDAKISAALQEKEEAIAAAIREKEEAIAAAIAEKNIAVTAAIEERDTAVLAAKTEKESTIQAMSFRQTQELDAERQKTAEAVAVIKRSTSDYIAYIERSVDAIVLQISTMQEEVKESRYENNYTNVISHLSQKVFEFERWFKREVVAAQEDNTWSVNDVQKILQDQLLPLLGNNYTWVSEMMRFTAYCGISRQFKDQFHKSGIPTDYLRNAYAETVTLFGRMGITLLVPSLFADDFNPECHKLNNAPLINSFFPHTFMEYKPESKGMIYDVLRPGYSFEGEVKQLPEVCVY